MIKHCLLNKKNWRWACLEKNNNPKLNQLSYDPAWLDFKLQTTEETHNSAVRASPLIENIFNHNI